jgi:hypothetical protein
MFPEKMTKKSKIKPEEINCKNSKNNRRNRHKETKVKGCEFFRSPS